MKPRHIAATLVVGSVVSFGGLAAKPSTAATTPPPSSPEQAPIDQPGEPLHLGLAPVTLLSPPTTDAGNRPTFTWMPVDGAASYALALLTTADEPLWAWQGAATEVVLGGWSTPPPAEAFGPLLPGAANWFVVAFDAAGAPMANSVIRPVAP